MRAARAGGGGHRLHVHMYMHMLGCRKPALIAVLFCAVELWLRLAGVRDGGVCVSKHLRLYMYMV